MVSAGAILPNVNQFTQNCNINNTTNSANDFDGINAEMSGEWR